jgi:Tol biopolymer transport system component
VVILVLAPRAVSATTITQITFDGADDSGPAWSPDGTRIAFVSNRTGGNEIWVMNADGSDATRITFNGVYEGGPTFTPDGQWIVYDSSLASEYQEELYRVPATGGPPLRLTYNDRRDLEPTAGFTGSWVICHTVFDGWDVAIYDAMSGILVTLATLHPAHDVEPGFAPAMDRIVFQSDRSGNRDIWIAPLPAGDQGTQLTTWSGDDIQPNWSRPQNLIAWASDRLWGEGRGAPGEGALTLDQLTQLPFDIWITTEDGTFMVPITTDGLYNTRPRWSPDGERIAFHSHRNGNWDIFIADDLPLVTPVTPATWGAIKAQGAERALYGR